MRHFAKAQQELGRTVQYVQLDDPDNTQTLAGELARPLKASAPEQVVMTEPGDYRVLKAIEQCAADQGCTLPRTRRHPLRHVARRIQKPMPKVASSCGWNTSTERFVTRLVC